MFNHLPPTCSAAKLMVIYSAALKVSGLINFLFQQTAVAIQKLKRTRTKTTMLKLLEGWGERQWTHIMRKCVFIQVLRTHIIAVFMVWSRVCVCGRRCLLASRAQIHFFLFFKKEKSLRTFRLRKEKLACSCRAVVFECGYVNLAGSPLATNSWVRRQDTHWRGVAKICHSDTNDGDPKRSGVLAELRDSKTDLLSMTDQEEQVERRDTLLLAGAGN